MGARSKIAVQINPNVMRVTETHWGAEIQNNGFVLLTEYPIYADALELARLPRFSGHVLPYKSALMS